MVDVLHHRHPPLRLSMVWPLHRALCLGTAWEDGHFVILPTSENTWVFARPDLMGGLWIDFRGKPPQVHSVNTRAGSIVHPWDCFFRGMLACHVCDVKTNKSLDIHPQGSSLRSPHSKHLQQTFRTFLDVPHVQVHEIGTSRGSGGPKLARNIRAFARPSACSGG